MLVGLALIEAPLLAGCTSAAEVPVPSPPGAAVAACTALASELPQEVAGQPRRRTVPHSPFTAAWGDPAITLRCGVDLPASYTATGLCTSINGVDWLPAADGVSGPYTAVGRAAFVAVDLPPTAYDPAQAVVALTDLSPAVSAAVPVSAAPGCAPAPSR
jgi:hypothetical protein